MSTELVPAEIFTRALEDHLRVVEQLRAQEPTLETIARRMSDAICGGNKILWCGNGGSAADSQHLAAEFVGRFRRERRGLPSIALTTDTSILTSIGNDYGYEEVFRRQVEAHCQPGDVLVGISTSGNSPNVLAALEEGKRLGAFVVAFTGEGGGKMAAVADAAICVPTRNTARVQEGHILCGHMLCDWAEIAFCEHHARNTVAEPAGSAR
jgi:D-sedoheptulose 7-phosphate isomerase